MAFNDYYNETITFIKDQCSTKQQVFDKLVTTLVDSKMASDKEALIHDLKERENIGSTAMGDGIAIPHCASKTVKKSTIAIMTLKQSIDWQNDDNNKTVDLIFMITTPLKLKQQHLQVLAQLASFLVNKEVVEKIRNANSFDDIDQIFSGANLKKEANVDSVENFDVVAITACPTGIAHTYMAKEKIEEAAIKMGYTVKVETRGRSGGENILTEKDIANAKVIILAIDKKIIGMDKFKGYKYLETSTKDVIYNGEKVIEDYLQGKRLILGSGKKQSNDEVAELTLKNFKDVTKNLLGGVSSMLPFVVAGGIILGIGFLLDSGNYGGNFGVTRSSAAWFSGLGKVIFAMMVPILGAYVCYSIVGPQGLLPGMTCGLIANAPEILYDAKNKTGQGWSNVWGRIFPDSISNFNSGFFGALVGSYIIAFFIYACQKGFSRFYKSFRGVRDIVLIPVLTALAAGVLMFALNIPLGYLNLGFGLLLEKIANYNLNALVGIIIGLMMAIDMGGPINKAAYVFSTLTIDSTQTIYASIRSTNGGTIFMAASMLAGMIPPLALAISTRLFGKVWSKKDKESGNTNWFLSACFITEGAIPYAASDPKRVVPSVMVGSALTGAIVSGFGVTLAAPHGGIFVFPLLRIQDNGSNWFKITSQGGSIGLAIIISLIAVLIGAFVSAIILGFWRKNGIKNNKLNLTR